MAFRAWNNFPAGAGQVVRSNLFLLGHNPFLAGQMSFIEDYPIALCSKIHADCSNNTLQHNTPYSWVCGDDFIEDKAITRNSRKMKNHCYRPAAQGFWNFARSQSRGIQVNLGNPAKFTKTREISRNSVEILPNTCHFNIFETSQQFRLMELFFAVHLQIYFETSSLLRENIPKTARCS